MHRYMDQINNRIEELLKMPGVFPVLRDAMHYSVTAGGKRLRPTLNLMANALLDGRQEETLDIACAIEMIHTYSLIHDDLPAMDNDELRRGKPTSHVMFGEAFAILAGDGLLNYAYEVMLQNALRFADNMTAHTKAMAEIARGAGVGGMLTGQCADIENEGQILTEQEITYVHEHKTGAMITSALLSGLLLCSPDKRQVEALTAYGNNIGLTFQIIDDILDITGSEKQLGKSIGKDRKAKKFTFPTLYGVERSRQIAEEKTQEAVEALAVFGEKGIPLAQLALSVLERNR